MALSVMPGQLNTARLFKFSTIRNEVLSECSAPFLSFSKPFDVSSQQLCVSGQGASQKPTRAPYTLA